MGLYNPSSVVHKNAPREFPQGLVHIFDMVVGYADGRELSDGEVTHICDHLCTFECEHDQISAGDA